MKKRILTVIIILLSVLLLSACKKHGTSTVPVAKGHIDLRKHNFSRDGIVALNGQWEFFWNRLMGPDDLTLPRKSEYRPVPMAWDRYRNDTGFLPENGHATYHLTISAVPEENLALYLHSPISASRIWINGTEQQFQGIPGTSMQEEKPWFVPAVFQFCSRENKIDLIIQVSNYHFERPGIINPIMLGTSEQIFPMRDRRLIFNIILFSFLLAIALYNLVLFFLRPGVQSSLWFGFFGLLASVWALNFNERFLLQIYPDLDWHIYMKAVIISISISVPVFFKYISCLFPELIHSWLNRIIYAVGIIFSLLVIFSSSNIYMDYFLWYRFWAIPCGLYFLIIIGQSLRKKERDAVALITAFIILFTAIGIDILIAHNIIQIGFVMSIGTILFFMVQAFFTSFKLSKDFDRIEQFSVILEKEVALQTEVLKIEQSKLKNRNNIMEKELEMARGIQQQLIPDAYFNDSIYSLYRPMELVGGDFFEFIKFRDSETIGIFISDVSGHGVPAAFITSMIKTILLQVGEIKHDPAALLTLMNYLLLDKTDKNFITALYAVFDPRHKKIIYSSAGHSPPFILDSQGASRLPLNKSLPLAILDNKDLIDKGKMYENKELVLEGNSKVLLYTDGLIEAQNIYNPRGFFEEWGLQEALLELKTEDSKNFILKLYERLVKFRGNDSFEDDVCLICVDIN